MANKKEFDGFISYRHADAEAVNKIYDWLQNKAGFNIWYDQKNLAVGQNIASELPKEIVKCRAVLIMISNNSIKSGWVEEEYTFAIGYQKEESDFKVIPIRIDDAEMPGFLKNKLYLNIPNGNFTAETALLLIDALYNVQDSSDFLKLRDVYLSRSWKEADSAVANLITAKFKKSKSYRFIGDCEDQNSFSEIKGVNRVELIVRSCGAMVAILPDRGNGQTSPYILKEIGYAISFGLPVIVIKEEATEYKKLADEEVLTVDKDTLAEGKNLDNLISNIYDSLQENYKPVKKPLYFFWASNFDNKTQSMSAKRLIEKTTAMSCLRGDEIQDEQVQTAIINRISDAFIMIADITGENINTCIECGIALGAGTKLFLFSGSKRETPKPFMLRNNQVYYYETEAEQIGTVHRLIRPYRRRVFNNEPD